MFFILIYEITSFLIEKNSIAAEKEGTPSKSLPFLSPLISNTRITSADHFQDVRLIKFSIKESNIK